MILELRIYHMYEGKMGDICKRFAELTLPLFKEHGIKVVNFWVDAEGKEKLYYICEFDSVEAKDAAWKEFAADERWIAGRNESEKNGRIVEKVESYLMNQADFFE